ncbi:MAG: tRNA (adenosine(37)-N6)-threonylcarbamoyltransferase complex transferase subunit TsaD [Chloroflexota bacterium]|nr:MAG: tRNA (adenosine(37)-N6)-threonylcarbamoyltransferase complex transferase subunit TsaD [Chloroflexota bacterium]
MSELILGIETSCDETAAAVILDGCRILSNVVASQAEMHAKFGGVFPEVASREHVLKIIPVIDEAMNAAQVSWNDLRAIAVTHGPGLAGSLLVGVNAAKGIALGKSLPLLGTNHLEGHIYANWLDAGLPYVRPEMENVFPLVALIASGGHSSLVLMRGHGEYMELGHTIDDAAGEAFDKIARLLHLGYPGGPAIQRAAEQGDASAFKLPRAQTKRAYDFSFSGLKTAVLNLTKKLDAENLPVNDIAASAQQAIVDMLVEKTHLAVEEYDAKYVLLAGGVAANKLLRQEMSARASRPVIFPPPKLCVDNGAMIAAAAFRHYRAGQSSAWDLDVVPNLKLA